MPRKAQFTSKVRRGLALVRYLAISAQRPYMPMGYTIVEGWSAAQRSDYEAAMKWIEQEERDAGVNFETVEREW